MAAKNTSVSEESRAKMREAQRARRQRERNNGDPVIDGLLLDTIYNALSGTRWQDMAREFGGDVRRSYYDECGWPDTITWQDYWEYYERESIATRVVESWPKETWKVTPQVYETEDVDEVTKFEAAVSELDEKLRGEQSWYNDEDGSSIWDELMWTDIKSGIGRYGGVLIGIDDGLELSQPVQPGANRNLIYLRAMNENEMAVGELIRDKNDRRYNRPLNYNVQFADEDGSATPGKVHWSRIVHFADNCAPSQLYGRPRMQPNYNKLMDLRKTYGGSAEAMWKNGMRELYYTRDARLAHSKPLTDAQKSAMRDVIERLENSIQRRAVLEGMNPVSIGADVSDPTAQINVLLEAIAIQMEMPKRILMGSERGELSSSQDTREWRERLMMRRYRTVTPRLIVPLFNRLIMMGVLPEPADGYSCVWPVGDILTEVEKSEIGLRLTQALTQYVQSGSDSLIEIVDWLTKFIGMSEDDAKEVLANRLESIRREARETTEAPESEQPEDLGEEPA